MAIRPTGPDWIACDHLGVAERLDIAVALKLLLVVVHRARDIDGEDQFEVDLDLRGRRRGEREHRAEGEGDKCSAVHATTLRLRHEPSPRMDKW